MKSVVRLLLICLLALALPVQGVAAATMQFCAAAHKSQTLLFEAASHSHHAVHPHGSAQHASADDQDTLAKQTCSACAACCMAVALPPAALALPAVDPAIEAAPMLTTAYVGPDAVGLERPPRSSFA